MKKKLIFSLLGIVLVIALAIVYFTTLRTFSVIFDSQGGTWFKTEEVRINKKAQEPGEPILEGYTFLGWYLDNELYDFNRPVTKNITLVAKWKEN